MYTKNSCLVNYVNFVCSTFFWKKTKRFDLIWLVRDIKNAQRDEKIARHVIELHSVSFSICIKMLYKSKKHFFIF
jgi:hypothetical protein